MQCGHVLWGILYSLSRRRQKCYTSGRSLAPRLLKSRVDELRKGVVSQFERFSQYLVPALPISQSASSPRRLVGPRCRSGIQLLRQGSRMQPDPRSRWRQKCPGLGPKVYFQSSIAGLRLADKTANARSWAPRRPRRSGGGASICQRRLTWLKWLPIIPSPRRNRNSATFTMTTATAPTGNE